VTTAHVNLDLGVWIFKEHKTAKRTSRPRVIYLTPAMVEQANLCWQNGAHITRRTEERLTRGDSRPYFRAIPTDPAKIE
jgi:hypothetical protein